MKNTIEIALTELKSIFFSPIAWLVLIVFMIQTGIDFINLVQLYHGIMAAGEKVSGITSLIFTGDQGLFGLVRGRLYLYIPLLTMGLMSREISTGSIKLLLSSPVKIREIIFGKLVAILTYFLLFILVLIAFITVAVFTIESADIGLMVSGLLGIFFMCILYCSIGLFMSSLTSYQAIAALSTFAALATLNFIGSVWQDVDLLRNAASFLSIRGRTEQMIDGLITTRQLAYFLIMSGLFIAFAIAKLKFERRSVRVRMRILKYSSLIVIAILLGYVTSLPSLTFYIDMTNTKDQTISDSSQVVLSKMLPIKVHTYVNMLDWNAQFGLPAYRNQDKMFFDRFQRFVKNPIQIDYTYFYDSVRLGEIIYGDNPGVSIKDLAENAADSKGLNTDHMLDPESIRKIVDLKPRFNKFTRQFEVDGKTTMVGMFGDLPVQPGEKEIMDAFKLLTRDKPQVAFLTGHNERVARDWGTRDRDYNRRMNSLEERMSMVNHGFNFREINVENQDVPADISLLIIADPTLEIKADEMSRVQKYIENGGDLMINGEADRQSLINPLINPLGVRFMPGYLLSDYEDYPPNFVVSNFAKEAVSYSRALRQLYEDSAGLTTTGVSGLLYDTMGSFTIKPFLVTNKNHTWNHLGAFDREARKIPFDSTKGDRKGTYPIALTLKRQIRGMEQRIMIFGDADMLSDGEFNGYRKKNWELTTEIFKWFTNGEFPMDIYSEPKPDEKLFINMVGILWLKSIFLFAIPLLLLSYGAILLLTRRKR